MWERCKGESKNPPVNGPGDGTNLRPGKDVLLRAEREAPPSRRYLHEAPLSADRRTFRCVTDKHA
jgi:hypothetical protein